MHVISEYLQVPYTLPKIDQIVIPHFKKGVAVNAMENWGLVTYREKSFFVDPKYNSSKTHLKVSEVISHELSHQWFGNLVSPKWWKYIWLNEGFATLIANIGVDIIHPELNAIQHFVTDRLHVHLELDVNDMLRPMNFDAESPEEVRGLFDSITYGKSACVIRMFLHAFTENTFRKGLKYYLTKHSYGATDENDLFESLERAAKEDNVIGNELSVKDMFGSWSNQRGFPLLRVTRDYTNGSVTVRQEKYYGDNIERNDSATWWIPYSFASKSNSSLNVTAPHKWLPRGTRSKLIEQTENHKWTNDDWLVFNLQQTGYYRVLYDEENYKLLVDELSYGDINRIHPLSRSQIINDLHNFVLAGFIEKGIFLDLMSYFQKETEYATLLSFRIAYSDLFLRENLNCIQYLRKLGVTSLDSDELYNNLLGIVS